MGRKRKVNIDALMDTTPELAERNTQMFIDWYNGLTYSKIAEKYSLNISTVQEISKKGKWPRIRIDMNARVHANNLNQWMRMSVQINNVLMKDLKTILRKVEDGGVLNTDERAHMMKMLKFIAEQQNIDAGRPKELENNTMKVEINLPAGVTDFGVTPADARSVKVIEHQDRKEDDAAVDLDLHDANTEE